MRPVAELVALQDDYRTWLDALPQNLETSATAEALRAICDLDLSYIESVEPPRGFEQPAQFARGTAYEQVVEAQPAWPPCAPGR
jgi:hypothetical protein